MVCVVECICSNTARPLLNCSMPDHLHIYCCMICITTDLADVKHHIAAADFRSCRTQLGAERRAHHSGKRGFTLSPCELSVSITTADACSIAWSCHEASSLSSKARGIAMRIRWYLLFAPS